MFRFFQFCFYSINWNMNKILSNIDSTKNVNYICETGKFSWLLFQELNMQNQIDESISKINDDLHFFMFLCIPSYKRFWGLIYVKSKKKVKLNADTVVLIFIDTIKTTFNFSFGFLESFLTAWKHIKMEKIEAVN